jgi:ATP-dependent Clp protease ATP-binding subunit ClpB
MSIICNYGGSTLVVLLLVSAGAFPGNAFVPSIHHGITNPSFTASKAHRVFGNLDATNRLASGNFLRQSLSPAFSAKYKGSALRMAAEDFNESKYTEAAWSAIASLTKVADFYQASSVEAPFLLDILLNPSKHNAGDDAESAKRVVEKVLQKAGANVKDLRSELEKYLGKQARVSDNTQKVMGRTLQKVLENARDSKGLLGVSNTHQALLSFRLLP